MLKKHNFRIYTLMFCSKISKFYERIKLKKYKVKIISKNGHQHNTVEVRWVFLTDFPP